MQHGAPIFLGFSLLVTSYCSSQLSFKPAWPGSPSPTTTTTTVITTGTTQEKSLRGGGTWFPFPQALGVLRDTSQAGEGGKWARGLKQLRWQTGAYEKPAQGAPWEPSLVVKTVSSGVRRGFRCWVQSNDFSVPPAVLTVTVDDDEDPSMFAGR